MQPSVSIKIFVSPKTNLPTKQTSELLSAKRESTETMQDIT